MNSKHKVLCTSVFCLLIVCGQLGAQTTAKTSDAKPTTQPLQDKTVQLSNLVGIEQKALAKLIGDPVAQSVSDCALVPIGQRACGGPSGYVVFSKKNGKADQIKATVEKITDLQIQLNQLSQMMGDCRFIQEPEVIIANGRCTISNGQN